MILVTTPTGDIGGRVLRHLVSLQRRVRVLARTTRKLPDHVREEVEVLEGSHGESGSIAEALEGVDTVFWLPPGNPHSSSAHAAYVDFSRPFCDALRASTVQHVVGVSALGRGWHKPAGLVSASIEMDDLIASTGVHYRALACASLMDNTLRQIDVIRSGRYYQPTPAHVSLPHVAKADVAAVAIKLLTSTDWTGVEDIPLYGPEDLSYDEIAAILSDLLGHTVEYHAVPMKAFELQMREHGVSESMARAYADMMTAKNEGMDAIRPGDDRSATPTSFRQWCENELRPAMTQNG